MFLFVSLTSVTTIEGPKSALRRFTQQRVLLNCRAPTAHSHRLVSFVSDKLPTALDETSEFFLEDMFVQYRFNPHQISSAIYSLRLAINLDDSYGRSGVVIYKP